VESRLQVDVQDEVPGLVVEVVEGPIPGDPRVVHHDVDLAELARGPLHHLPGIVQFDRVVGGKSGLGAGLLDQLSRFFRRIGVHVVDHDGRPLLGEPDRRGPADASAGARDHGDLPFQASQGNLLEARDAGRPGFVWPTRSVAKSHRQGPILM
jgi:hypothetical protein